MPALECGVTVERIGRLPALEALKYEGGGLKL